MPRQKQLAPDVEGGGYYRNSVFHIDELTRRATIRHSQYREIVNEAKVPALCGGWQSHVAPCFKDGLTADETACLDQLIGGYVRERVVHTNPIAWKDLLERLQRLSAASKALLDELNDWSLPCNTVWTRVGDASEQMENARLTRHDVYPVVSKLYEAAELASFEAQLQKLSGSERAHKGPWLELIYGLADLAEFKGMKTTAAKSANSLTQKATNARGSIPYASQSPFTKLVWTVMVKAVPESLREHTRTQGAIHKPISDALALRRKSKAATPAGPFCEIPDRIKPAS